MRYCFFLSMSVDGLIHYGLVAWFPLPQMTIYPPRLCGNGNVLP